VLDKGNETVDESDNNETERIGDPVDVERMDALVAKTNDSVEDAPTNEDCPTVDRVEE